jgi:hypothetical protein
LNRLYKNHTSKKTHVKKKHALFQDYLWIIDTYIIFVQLQFTDVFFLELQGEVIFRLVLFLQIPTQRWRNILWLVVMSVVVSEVILFKSLCDSVVSLWSKPKPSWKITWVLGLMSFRNGTYYIKGFPLWVKTWNDVRIDAFTIGVAMVAVAHFSHKVDSCGSVPLLCTFALCAQNEGIQGWLFCTTVCLNSRSAGHILMKFGMDILSLEANQTRTFHFPNFQNNKTVKQENDVTYVMPVKVLQLSSQSV